MARIGTIRKGQTNKFRLNEKITRDYVLILFSNDYCGSSFTALFENKNPNCEPYTIIDIIEVGNATGTVNRLTGKISFVTSGTWEVKIYEQDSSTNLVTSLADAHVYNGEVQVVGQSQGANPQAPKTVTIIDGLNPASPISALPGEKYTCETGVCEDATVNVNGNLFDTVASGGTLNVPVVNQDDDPVGVISGGKVVVADPPIAYNYPLTGQTTIYATSGGVEGDDAWVEQNVIAPRRIAGKAPILVDFFNLHSGTPNKWGGTERFTDTLGGQVYANDIVQDHGTGFEYYRLLTLQSQSWHAGIVACLGTDYAGGTNATNGFTDWFSLNYTGWNLIRNFETGGSNGLNYSPFNIASQFIFSSSSSSATATPQLSGALTWLNNNKTSNRAMMFCRLIDQ